MHTNYYSLTVNDVDPREPIQIQSQRCRRVTVIESPAVANWPTTDYAISAVETGGVAFRRIAGQPAVVAEVIGQTFTKGEKVAFINTANPGGTTTFIQIEEW